eukprot:UN03673
MPTIFAVIFFVLWIQVTLLMYSNDKKDTSVITINNDIHISLNSQIQGASLILSIFCFKQTFMTFMSWYVNCQQDTAIAIKMAPRIKWKLSDIDSKSIHVETPKCIQNYTELEINLENGSSSRNIDVIDGTKIEEIQMHKITKLKKKHQQGNSLSIEL